MIDGRYLCTDSPSYQKIQILFRLNLLKKSECISPPGKAKCFIGLSDHKDYLYELHCKATIGNGDGTLQLFSGDPKTTKDRFRLHQRKCHARHFSNDKSTRVLLFPW